MSKNRGVQYSREEWVARRNSRSMGQTLRRRERFIHVSVPILLVDEGKPTAHYEINKQGIRTYINKPEKYRLHIKGTDIVLGRNQRKREHRATKSSRGFWRYVA